MPVRHAGATSGFRFGRPPPATRRGGQATWLERYDLTVGDTEKESVRERAVYRPMSRDITASLRQAILEGRLQPGERIGQESIAGEYGVSRIPVREALRQLENEGLITQIPHAGARVSQHDAKQMLELYLLRESLEPLLLSQSVVNLTDSQLGELHDSMDRVRAAETDVQIWLLEDRVFHLSSFQAADMPLALGLAERFYNQTQSHRRAFFGSLDQTEIDIVHLEHRLILDAIERRAPEEAAELQRMHVRRTRKRLAAANAISNMTDGPTR